MQLFLPINEVQFLARKCTACQFVNIHLNKKQSVQFD